jgi:hypothetical protein
MAVFCEAGGCPSNKNVGHTTVLLPRDVRAAATWSEKVGRGLARRRGTAA